MPGPDGVPLQQPIHVRQVMEDAPRTNEEMEGWLEHVGGER